MLFAVHMLLDDHELVQVELPMAHEAPCARYVEDETFGTEPLLVVYWRMAHDAHVVWAEVDAEAFGGALFRRITLVFLELRQRARAHRFGS